MSSGVYQLESLHLLWGTLQKTAWPVLCSCPKADLKAHNTWMIWMQITLSPDVPEPMKIVLCYNHRRPKPTCESIMWLMPAEKVIPSNIWSVVVPSGWWLMSAASGQGGTFHPHTPFRRSAHTRVARLTKTRFHSNVKKRLKLIFWASSCLHWNERKKSDAQWNNICVSFSLRF